MLYYTSTKSHRNQSWGFQIGFQTDLLLFQRVSHLRIAGLVDEPWRQGACGFFLHVLVSIFLLFFPSLHLVLLILIVSSISRSMLGALLVPSPVLSCCVQHGWNSQLLPMGLEDAPLYRFIQQPLENSSLVGWSQAVLTVSVLSAKPYTQLCKETWGSHLEWPLDQSRDSIEFASSFCPKLARSLLMEARTCAASCAPGASFYFFLNSVFLHPGLALVLNCLGTELSVFPCQKSRKYTVYTQLASFAANGHSDGHWGELVLSLRPNNMT